MIKKKRSPRQRPPELIGFEVLHRLGLARARLAAIRRVNQSSFLPCATGTLAPISSVVAICCNASCHSCGLPSCNTPQTYGSSDYQQCCKNGIVLRNAVCTRSSDVACVLQMNFSERSNLISWGRPRCSISAVRNASSPSESRVTDQCGQPEPMQQLVPFSATPPSCTRCCPPTGMIGYYEGQAVCCSSGCGMCGGQGGDCMFRPGHVKFCCGQDIVLENRTCSSPNDVGCVLPLLHTTDHAPAVTSASDDSSPRANRWAGVCRTERNRGRQYIRAHLPRRQFRDAERSMLLPLQQSRSPNVTTTLARLRLLLELRGMLCSKDAACSVWSWKEQPEKFQICLEMPPSSTPSMACELVPKLNSSQFAIKKGCTKGTLPRCFAFDTGVIDVLIEGYKRTARAYFDGKHAPTQQERPRASAAVKIPPAMKRCAVVLSGHTLRCGEPWASLIDSQYYDAVFRANWMHWWNARRVRLRRGAGGVAPLAGTKVNFSSEVSDRDCRLLPAGAACVEQELKLAMAMDEPKTLGPGRSTGLGVGRSGGNILNVALGHCDAVDVFGSGMFSDGPGSDTVYQRERPADWNARRHVELAMSSCSATRTRHPFHRHRAHRWQTGTMSMRLGSAMHTTAWTRARQWPTTTRCPGTK